MHGERLREQAKDAPISFVIGIGMADESVNIVTQVLHTAGIELGETIQCVLNDLGMHVTKAWMSLHGRGELLIHGCKVQVTGEAGLPAASECQLMVMTLTLWPSRRRDSHNRRLLL